MNTFYGTDGREWGYGDDLPNIFSPTSLDADQWVSTLKNAGLTQVVLTCKHHDGFCLWPSKYTDYSVESTDWHHSDAVKNTPWHGDIVKAVSDSCHKYGLKFGVYLSPWDRHRADYGLPGINGNPPSYVEYYRNQLRELLTNYGEISEVWFDGANGGDGWYGGADETRTIDNKTYYDWDNTYKLVRKLAPNAVMCQGADLRWCGTEEGYAGETNWNTMINGYPGTHTTDELQSGDENGNLWCPSEVDTSIRHQSGSRHPNWFYHSADDSNVWSPQDLFNIYLDSVGRGAGLILNVPPDRRGLIHDNDIAALQGWKQMRDSAFSNNLVKNIEVSKDKKYYEINFKQQAPVNYIVTQEDIKNGQKIKIFEVDAWQDDGWQNITSATTIGNKRILKLDTPITTNKLRINITDFIHQNPIISNIEIY